MRLAEHYDALYSKAIQKIESDDCKPDPLLDSITDNRFGVTLLLRPPASVKHQIQQFLTELKAIEPDQYYYPDSDIHVTVISVISCYDGFNLAQISIPAYTDIIHKSLAGKQPFEIEFKGITASPAGVMVQGFIKDETLNAIRNSLRSNFKSTDLEQSIDKRYTIQTAHATVVRFRKHLTRKEAFINALNSYRDFNFGTFRVNTLEFVFNDWYQREEHVKQLCKFDLHQ